MSFCRLSIGSRHIAAIATAGLLTYTRIRGALYNLGRGLVAVFGGSGFPRSVARTGWATQMMLSNMAKMSLELPSRLAIHARRRLQKHSVPVKFEIRHLLSA